ncbi:hypothetical protein O181_015837 [Austropuccinia psidii MF-1]|uniref:Uncharacterized protein n=1 Tax=Austropuccinia psidii MF-1 TaxID=1389203 RepID=A0A9Q3C2U8_9BASI|nr:hypothetical protein [Austropuccinia psidii MF-1]
MSPVHLRNLGIPRNQPEDREGLFKTRRPARGHLRHSGLEGYESSSSAPPTPQRFFPMNHGQQEAPTSIPLSRTWSKLPENMSQRYTLQRSYGNHQRMESHQAVWIPGGDGNQAKGESSHYPSYRRTDEPDRSYYDSFRITRSRPTQLSSIFQEKTRIQGQKQDFFKPKADRVRPSDPEAVRIGERSTQDPEIVVNTFRISSSNNKNITPTQNEPSVVTAEINLNSDALWLQMSQYAEKTQRQFAELQESHFRMEKLTASMHKIVKTLQESHAQLIKASEETNKRLNQVFEGQNRCKRDSDCQDQDLNKLSNVYQNMKPQPQGHVLDNPYHQEDIKPDSLLENKASFTLDDIANTLQDVRKRTKIGKYSQYRSSSFKEKQPFKLNFKYKPKERVAEVAKKKNSRHNCGSTDHYSNNCPKENKNFYAIQQVPEEECPTEDSESDSMGDGIREQCDLDQDPREEFLVEYQQETQLETQDMQLETGMAQETAKRIV